MSKNNWSDSGPSLSLSFIIRIGQRLPGWNLNFQTCSLLCLATETSHTDLHSDSSQRGCMKPTISLIWTQKLFQEELGKMLETRLLEHLYSCEFPKQTGQTASVWTFKRWIWFLHFIIHFIPIQYLLLKSSYISSFFSTLDSPKGYW